MNSFEELKEAEQRAWADGDLKTSQLLNDAIRIAEEHAQEAIEEYESSLSEKIDGGKLLLEALHDKIDEAIERLEE